VAAILHFLWLAKVGRTEPYYYAGWLGLALGVRVWDAARRRLRRRRLVALAATAVEPRPRSGAEGPPAAEKIARLQPQ